MTALEVLLGLAIGVIFVVWLIIPKNENRELFHKSGKLYNDGDNT